jgi:ribosomal protein S27AE
MVGADKRGNKKLERCPKCGSVFVEWDPTPRRFRCLVRKCGWAEAAESDPGTYNYITGSHSSNGRRMRL